MARKNGDGSFRTLSNGTIEFQVTVGIDIYGKRQRKAFYGKTEAECRRQYKQFLKEGEPKSKSKEHTLSGWLDEWLTTYKKHKVQEATYEDYNGLAAHVKQHKIGSMKLSQIKPIHITEFFGSKSDYSYSFLKRIKFLLNGAFTCAIDNDLCIKNPVKSAEAVEKVRPEKEAFTEEEVQSIINFAKTDEGFGLAIYLMFQTGMRSQEIRALTVDKIDFTGGVITIDKAIKRNGELGLPKNNKTRYIPINPEVAEFIKTKITTSKYILGDTHYITMHGFRSKYNWFFNRLNKKLKESGQEPINPKSPHSIRHTVATHWQINGMPIAMVCQLLGHRRVLFFS